MSHERRPLSQKTQEDDEATTGEVATATKPLGADLEHENQPTSLGNFQSNFLTNEQSSCSAYKAQMKALNPKPLRSCQHTMGY
jgi:hypothetical protein